MSASNTFIKSSRRSSRRTGGRGELVLRRSRRLRRTGDTGELDLSLSGRSWQLTLRRHNFSQIWENWRLSLILPGKCQSSRTRGLRRGRARGGATRRCSGQAWGAGPARLWGGAGPGRASGAVSDTRVLVTRVCRHLLLLLLTRGNTRSSLLNQIIWKSYKLIMNEGSYNLSVLSIEGREGGRDNLTFPKMFHLTAVMYWAVWAAFNSNI